MNTQADPRLDDAVAAALLPERDVRGHKGTFGRVSVVAGSLDYAGAALMAGTAALRMGAGLVTLFLPGSLQPYLAGRVPELITRALPELAPGEVDGPAAAALIEEQAHDALLVGPGLPATRGTHRLVMSLLAASGSTAVIDAGALGVLAENPGWPSRVQRSCVLTPHPGEAARLGIEAGETDTQRRSAAIDAAAGWHQVLVLKGARSVIARPEGPPMVSPFSVPALATAGSGDVLAGVIASWVAQGLEPFEAAALGVYVHGSAGENISQRLGDAGMLATDLLSELPRVRRYLDHVRQRQQGPRLGFEAPAAEAGPGARDRVR